MKINITTPDKLLNGYTNIIDVAPNEIPITNTENTVVVAAKHHEVSKLCLEADEVVISFPLNAFQASVIPTLLADISKYLKVEGILSFYFSDIRSIAHAIETDKITMHETHKAVFGDKIPFNVILDLHIVKKVVKDFGFEVDQLEVDSFITSVKVRKVNA